MEQAPTRGAAASRPGAEPAGPDPSRPSPPRPESPSAPPAGPWVPRQAGAVRLRPPGGAAAPGAPSAAAGPSTAGGPSAAGAGRGTAASDGPGAPPPGPVSRTAGPGPDVPAGPPAGHREIRRHSVRGQILQALRTALLDGDLAPGEVYSAPALGLRFGVSATPVREAMQQLAAEGAVEVVPNRGFRIAVRSPRERAELAEVRALVETPVVLELARILPAAEWGGLRPAAEAAAAAAATGDRGRYAEADRVFHRAVLALAGNEQLVAVADDLHRRSQWPPDGVSLAADAGQHLRLLDALESGDAATARVLIEGHFGRTPGG
ncbi:GntR family transcriptional regulator [Streptomyces sp. NPDC003691]